MLDVMPVIRSRARCGLGSGRGSGLPRFTGQGRALDIGTGNGIYAATLARLGWKVTGVEFDPVTAENTARRLNLDIFTGSLDEAKFDANTFDFVSMFHVIEHLTDPIATLLECRRIMSDRAGIMIRTPNFDSLVRKKFGRFWRGVEAPRHLFLFNANSLTQVLEKAGFKITSVCTTRSATPYYLRMSRDLRSAEIEEAESKLISGALDRALTFAAKTGSNLGLLLGDELHVEAIKI
jgi:2-polyprenyl-3-methyl-5-hydroxy-6-metoxy-1,4-benzoquinol methylase